MSEAGVRNKRERSSSNTPRKKAKGEEELPPHRSGARFKPATLGESVGLDGRIILQSEIGKGASSTVYQCVDTKSPGKEYAVKFIRSSDTLRKATEKEIKLLRRFKTDATSADPEGATRLLGLASVEAFEHEGHLAMVFERQKCCLKTALKKYGKGGGLSLVNVQSVAKDIFLALRVLRKINVIHCDLKPANLLVSRDGVSVKLADFGSATGMSTRTLTDQLQPTYYRAPEIILGQLYGTEIDIWSAGLTLFQVATGHHLMVGPSNNAMLHAMLKTFGAFSKSFATAGKFAEQHFNVEGDFRLGYGYVPMSGFPAQPSPFLEKLESKIKDPPKGGDKQRHAGRLRHLADLLGQCVVPVPGSRVTPENALEHSFVKF